MTGRRTALIIANDEYEHPGLSRLKAPAADARALANVLGDKEIGDFRVQTVHNSPAHIVEGHIEDLFADSQSDDLVLLHFSGHGLKSDSGELFLATRNTRPDRLGSTAVPADFIQRCMRTSRARSIVLFLDCCYGGAFGEGVAVRGSGSANVLENFPAGRLGGGRGRAVITASSAMEYAFEGNSLADEHQQQPSIFTAALVEGLATGEADRDEDGLVSLNELYDYVFDQVRERNPKQTPGRDVELQGELYLARSKRRRLRALPIPGEVAGALKDDNMFTRLGAVAELRTRMTSRDLGAALGAHEALVEVARSDIKYVQDAAAEALADAALSPEPAELHFGRVPQDVPSVAQTIHLGGPPLAGAVTVSQSDPWLTARTEPSAVLVSIDTSQVGNLSGALTLTGPTGQVVVPVTAQVVEVSPASTAPTTPAPADAPAPIPTPAPPQAAPAQPAPTQAAPTQAAPTQPATAQPAPPTAAAEEPTPQPGTPAPARPAGRPFSRFSGIAAIVAGGLMWLAVVLPQQGTTSTWDNDSIKAKYLLYLGLVVVGLGVLALGARWRIEGLGGIIGAAGVSTVVSLDMVNTLDKLGVSELSLGFWVGFVAPLILLAAGVVGVMAARRETGAGFAALHASDWTSWVVLALAAAGALALVPPALDTYTSYPGWGVQGLWLALLAAAVPLTAVLTRPTSLGRGMLLGWALACAAAVLAIWLTWVEYDGTSHGMWFVLLTLVGMVAMAPILHRGRT